MDRRVVLIAALVVLLAAPAVALSGVGTNPSSPATSPASSVPQVVEGDEPPAELLGMEEDAAADLAVSAGWTWRVMVRDGEALPGTADYRPDRLNAEITDDVVTGISVG